MINYSRIKTRLVNVGNIRIGGNSAICIQSMTNTPTRDIESTVEQCKRIFDKGADLVRITVPAERDVRAIIRVVHKLQSSGYFKPVSADVHFNPIVAEQIARFVDKVRINPGNYIDKKVKGKIDFTDEEYKAELEKIHKRLLPLIAICKKHNTAIRIGTNHGSLSDRILSKYGDTPKGMVESTMEFIRIFNKENFHNIVVSLKSSNTRVMIYANRLFVKQMKAEAFNYPIHLGVTEAGDGEDGRIKSSVGIGTLLGEGIGDTIRVSLTEEPEKEIPVCKKLIASVNKIENHKEIPETSDFPFNGFSYSRRKSHNIFNIGSENVPVVIADLSFYKKLQKEDILDLAFVFTDGKFSKGSDQTPDFIYIGNIVIDKENFEGIHFISNFEIWDKHYKGLNNFYPLFTPSSFVINTKAFNNLHFLKLTYSGLSNKLITKIKDTENLVLLSGSENSNVAAEQKAILSILHKNRCKHPVIPFHSYDINSIEAFQVQASFDFGPLFIDGLADGIMISTSGKIENKRVVSTAFGILQAARVRITKTEYISCPGCGRTLFDLQKVTAEIKKQTSHLKGLKIGIMGCIVNGPGEMADADYGYVGTVPGKVSLYKKQEVVKKNIPAKDALPELIKLIKENGDW